MEPFVVAIPSYHRADRQDTLQYLREVGFSVQRVFLVVQTEEDWAAYQKYKEWATTVHISASGIAQARNNILDYLSGRPILMMDDDISQISRLTENGLERVEDFEETFQKLFDRGSTLFGIYPVHNDFFMSRTVSTKVTVNTVLGFPADNKLRFDSSLLAKEDIDLCARILDRGGNVIRYNYLAPKAKHRTNSGGCHDTWKTKANEAAARRLAMTYPKVIARHPSKPDEVRVIIKDRKVKA